MAGRHTTGEVLDQLGIPEHRRISADRRLSQLRRGRSATVAGKSYPYEAELKEGKDFNHVGRYVFYTDAGVKKLRELLADYIE